MASLDSSDPINSIKRQVIETLQGFAAQDLNWENPDFVTGFPAIQPDDVLLRPRIAVYEVDSLPEDSGYDNVVATNDLLASDPLYTETRGVIFSSALFIDIWVNRPTAERKAPVGPLVASRIKGKILSRLRLHSECLGDLDLLEVRGSPEPFYPIDTNDELHMFERVFLEVAMVVID